MRTVLCFGDSNTYGFSPEWVNGKFERYSSDIRWTGRLQKLLGDDYRIIEEGLSGRTTVFNNPTSPGRCGLDYLVPCIESHQPIDLIIIMLGTNDCLPIFSATPQDIATGAGRLVKEALNRYNYVIYPAPKVLLAVPAPIEDIAVKDGGGIADNSAVRKSGELAKLYKMQADMLGVDYIDLGEYCSASSYDGVHLTAEAHSKVATAFADKIKMIFGNL